MSAAKTANRKDVLRLVRTVRRRWRVGLGLRGLAVAVAISGMVLFASAAGLELLRFTPEAVYWLRIFTWFTLGASLFAFVVRPLLRRVTDEQVALYLEEHEPSLDHAIVSALEADAGASVSPALASHLVEAAMQRAREVEFGRRVEQSRLYRGSGGLVALTFAALALATMGPEHLRIGLSALLVPTTDAAAVNPYAVSVQPGDVTIARGSDQMINAELSGFDSEEASVFTRRGPDGTFQRLSMLRAEDGSYEVLLLDVDERLEYFVESTGIRSRRFAIDVADLPYVDRMDLTYYFPGYTGLPARTVENGGDVAALPGTVVEVRVQPTMPVPGGELRLDGEGSVALSLDENGVMRGRFTVRQRGFYSVGLLPETGDMVDASPEYTIDVLTDQAPSIQFTKPGRDANASPIEEVYMEISADDDYGVGDVRLVYSVNGGPEDTTTIFQTRGAPLSEVSVGHTLYLEEYDLEPGDLVSFYGLVRDNRPDDVKAVSSDIYFLTIRPFERAYREAEGQGSPPPGGQGQVPESALSELQRQIIAATFNLIRQQDSYEADEFSENVVSVALAQERLEEQVATLLERMQNRGLVGTDPGFRDVSAILPRATEAMELAQAELQTESLRAALPHEQTALRFLQQAEETYERYVSDQQQPGGGGGGEQGAADDLADLFELELDKLKNQYETVRRGEQQQADDEVDEILERLKELARRQEQEAERQRRRAQRAGQGAPQGGSATQRDLAEEAEEAGRQLQRLARETGDAEMEEAARRLQEAAESMRQSASQGGSASAAEASSALERLEEARRRLEQNREDRARRDADDALRQVDELARQQRDVTSRVRDLPAGGQERLDAISQLRERKEDMTDAVAELERQLDRASQSAASDQAEAARRLRDAADQIRESKLKEKLQYSRGTIEQWDQASAATLELNIEADLQTLRDRIEEASEAAGERQVDPLSEALDQTRDLVRGLEAIQRRLEESPAGQPGETGQQPGQEPGQQQGQQGADGQQQGQQGADGQQVESAGSAGGATRGDPRRLSREEVRQFRSEFGQRGDQVRGLQDRLREAGRSEEDLRAVLDAMERLEREGIYDNPSQVAALQEDILELLKQLEFGLRREVEGDVGRRPALTTSDDVPEGYRRLVEEYYRALARGGGSGG
jgi:hypothetical protein